MPSPYWFDRAGTEAMNDIVTQTRGLLNFVNEDVVKIMKT